MLALQIPVTAASIDETVSPDRSKTQVLDHLIRYCSHFDPLPAITVEIEGEAARVVRGHKYLLAARSLGRTTIRAVVATPLANADVQRFIGRADVTVLDWEALQAREDEHVTTSWHVFFFERPLSEDEKRAFNDGIRGWFADKSIEVRHDDNGPAAEFVASTPVAEAWARGYLDVLLRFSREQVGIVSFQGSHFIDSETRLRGRQDL